MHAELAAAADWAATQYNHSVKVALIASDKRIKALMEGYIERSKELESS